MRGFAKLKVMHARKLMSSVTLAAVLPVLGTAADSNPLLKDWQTPFGVPPFAEIREEHFLPAIREAMARQRQEVVAVASRTDAATFANTIEALEGSGRDLDRASSVFSFLTGAETNEKLQALARELAPLRAAHQDAILLDPALFRRIKTVWDARATLSLTPEQQMLLERTYKRFARGGALLDEIGKDRLRALNSELASLSVQFGDNLLKEMNSWRLVIDQRSDLAGLPENLVSAAAETARKAGLDGKWVFTLHAPSIWPFLQYSNNRNLRRQIFTAYTTRRPRDITDNKASPPHRRLRTEKRGFSVPDLADFSLEENMARTPPGSMTCSIGSGAPLNPSPPAKPRRSRMRSRPTATVFNSNRGTGFITPKRSVRLNTNLMSPSFAPTSSWKTSATAPSGSRRNSMGSLSPSEGHSRVPPEAKVFEAKDADALASRGLLRRLSPARREAFRRLVHAFPRHLAEMANPSPARR